MRTALTRVGAVSVAGAGSRAHPVAADAEHYQAKVRKLRFRTCK